MDVATIAGLVLSFGAIFLSALLESKGGGMAALMRFLNLPAAMIVFGGTLGATMTCFRLKDFLSIGKYMSITLRENHLDIKDLITEMVRYAEMARKEGLLILEEMIANVKNDFLRKGIQLIVDGTDPSLVRDILEIETEYMEERHKQAIQIFQQAGGFAPTMGIIGTVMGLVSVLANLSDTGSLGPAISTAFIATFYGIFSANVIWLPIAAKLRTSSREEASARAIIIEGILSIQAGEHPRVIGEKLMSFLPPSKRSNAAGIGSESGRGR
jgi:chemotaxis protein MotA